MARAACTMSGLPSSMDRRLTVILPSLLLLAGSGVVKDHDLRSFSHSLILQVKRFLITFSTKETDLDLSWIKFQVIFTSMPGSLFSSCALLLPPLALLPLVGVP